MPNWNSNNMIVKGNVNDVLVFVKENFRTNKNPYTDKEEFAYILDFEEFLPTPLEEGTNEVIKDWYEWRNEHWGCKWSPNYNQCISFTLVPKQEGESDIVLYDRYDDPKNEHFNENNIEKLVNDNDKYKEAELQCYFETPWCPPTGMVLAWYEKYKEKDIELSLKYYEPGCEFAGEYYIHKDDCMEIYHDGTNTDELVEYLLEEGWESLDFYLDEVEGPIREMNEGKMDEEGINRLIDVIKDKLKFADNNKQRAMLISDIFNNYHKFLQEN